MGVNASSNAPRMLTSLAKSFRRGAQVVHVNPLIEAASTRTIVPHEMLDMALFRSTRIGTMNVQPRIAGDLALMRGVAKHLLEAAETNPEAVDQNFLDRFTSGFESYRKLVAATSWEEIELQSGVSEAEIRKLGELYRRSRAAIISWCLGVTQQEHAVVTVREIMNVLCSAETLAAKVLVPVRFAAIQMSRVTGPAASIIAPTKRGSPGWIRRAGSRRRASQVWTRFA